MEFDEIGQREDGVLQTWDAPLQPYEKHIMYSLTVLPYRTLKTESCKDEISSPPAIRIQQHCRQGGEDECSNTRTTHRYS